MNEQANILMEILKDMHEIKKDLEKSKSRLDMYNFLIMLFLWFGNILYWITRD